MALEATRSLTDYANQARNATSGEPEKVLIVLDSKMSRKAARYFEPRATPEEQEAIKRNIRKELEARGALVFEGDDTSVEGPSVHDAYEAALQALAGNHLYDPATLGTGT
jgi:CRISPR-associated protein Cst2